jgi:hypothetical protein
VRSLEEYTHGDQKEFIEYQCRSYVGYNSRENIM